MCLCYKNKCVRLLLVLLFIIFILSFVLEIIISMHMHLRLLQFIQQNENPGMALDTNSKTTVAASVELRELHELV